MDVSVITAVYDKEAVFEEYVMHTVLQRNIDFELIIVDDCSPDRCPVIMDKIAEKYSHVRVIHRDKNGGHVAAVNTGVVAANGQYIIIVDADDYLNYEYALHDMFEIAKRHDADAVFSDFNNHYSRENHSGELLVFSGRELLFKMLKEKWYHPTYRSRLYKATIMKNELPGNYIVDDEDWTPRAMFNSKVIAIYPRAIYTRTTPDNSVTRIISEQNYFRKSRDRIIVAKRLYDFFSSKDLSDDEKGLIYSRILNLFMMAIDIRVSQIKDKELQKQLDSLIEKNKQLFRCANKVSSIKYKFFNVIFTIFGVKRAMNLYKFIRE